MYHLPCTFGYSLYGKFVVSVYQSHGSSKGLIFMSLNFLTLTPSGSKAGNAAQPAGSNPKATMRRKGNACPRRRRKRGPGMVETPQVGWSNPQDVKQGPESPIVRNKSRPQRTSLKNEVWKFHTSETNLFIFGDFKRAKIPVNEPASWLGGYIQATRRTGISRKNGKHICELIRKHAKEQHLPTFRLNPGWFIGIQILFYHNPSITA